LAAIVATTRLTADDSTMLEGDDAFISEPVTLAGLAARASGG